MQPGWNIFFVFISVHAEMEILGDAIEIAREKTDIARILAEKERYLVKAITDVLGISRLNQYEAKKGRRHYGTRNDRQRLPVECSVE